jgi:hypothetical protein
MHIVHFIALTPTPAPAHAPQVAVEGLLMRIAAEEQYLQDVYREGDSDGDGVLSFQEFKDIFSTVEPTWHERKVRARAVLVWGDVGTVWMFCWYCDEWLWL